jgi:hypothetical protein
MSVSDRLRTVSASLRTAKYSRTIESLLKHVKRTRVRKKTLERGRGGPHAPSVTNTELYIVDISDWIEEVGEEEANLVYDSMEDGDPWTDALADAMGVGGPYQTTRGIDHPRRRADFEVLDDSVSAMFRSTLYIN